MIEIPTYIVKSKYALTVAGWLETYSRYQCENSITVDMETCCRQYLECLDAHDPAGVWCWSFLYNHIEECRIANDLSESGTWNSTYDRRAVSLLR